ncbi:MAG TPA: glycine oxidase ThiO [Beijerinckiaceae bacterium]
MTSLSDVLLPVGRRLAPPLAAPRLAQLPPRADVVVVGAGIIGLSIAWRLSQAGLDVAVVDRGEAGGGTTFSATGMLAAAAEHEPGGDALLPFARASQRLWPDFRAALEGESGVDIDYRASGVLLVALGREETERLRARCAYLVKAGLDARWLNGAELRALEPGLRPSATAAIQCADDHQVDPRAVVAALLSALARRGVPVVEHRAVAVERAGGAVTGVRSGDAICRVARVVLATGAWSGGDDGLTPPGLRLPLRPVKGQALALRARDGRDPLAHVVWTEQVHLAPKRDGRLIVGATMEEAGFDAAVTAGGVLALLDGARRAAPGLEELELEAVWTGFRPTTDDDAPILGAVDGSGLLVAAGHHRNGVLLAPATAQALTDLIIKGEMDACASALTLARFQHGDP